MKFKKFILVRDIENPSDYEVIQKEVPFIQAMTEDSFDNNFVNLFLNFLVIWFVICVFLASILGFIYLIKTFLI